MSKKRFAYGSLFVVVLITLIWTITKDNSKAPDYEPATVTRGTVLHTVSITGHIEPTERIMLAFPAGGRITSLPVEEGTYIAKDTIVAVLDGGIEDSVIREAQARAQKEQAMLQDLRAPLRSEEKAVKEATVSNAETAVNRTKESARKTIARAFVYADDAIHEEADELFDNTASNDPRFGVTFTVGSTEYYLKADAQTASMLSQERSTVEKILFDMQARTANMTQPIETLLQETDDDLSYIEGFLTKLAEVINEYTSDDSINQTVYESFQTSVASARTAITTARSEIDTAHTSIDSAEAAHILAERDLELSLAGTSQALLEAQEASLASALAAVGTAEERSQDNVLTTPFEGTLARIDYDVGEIVGPYEQVAELISDGAYEVEAYIPEADIARIRLGDRADITFDAFDTDDIFEAEVIRIALSETYREGVPTYKTTFRLTEHGYEDITLRPGMTADIEVYTDMEEDTLFVPVRSVIREDGRVFVRVFNDGTFIEKDITTGLRGSEGTVEVLSGLREGEEVVLYVEEA